MLHTSDLVTKRVLNTKISKIENKISSVSGLAKKTNYDVIIKHTQGKYFTTSDYNKYTSGRLDVKIKQKKNSINLILIKITNKYQ